MGKEYQQDIELFKNILKPLYSKLISDVKDFGKSKCFFCMQWGRENQKIHMLNPFANY